MNNKFSTTIASLVIVGLFAAGISYVSAFTVPGTPPSPNVATPINTGTAVQTKAGGIFSKKFLATGSGLSQPNTSTLEGLVHVKTLLGSAYGLFSDQVLVSGTSSRVKIGGTGGLVAPLINSSTYSTPLTIDLRGRPDGTAATEALEVITANSCADRSTVLVDTSAIRFADNSNPGSNSGNSHNVDLIARQLRLSDPSSAGTMKVLVATNSDGDAVWGTLSVVGGQIQVNYNESVVTYGQLCQEPVVDVCPNIAGNQGVVPDGMGKNVAGECVSVCPAGQSWNAASDRCTCDATGNPPMDPPTYPGNRGFVPAQCSATGVCVNGPKVQSPPVIIKKLRNSNGTPATMPDKCVIATKVFDACSDGDSLGEELYQDGSGNVYPIYSGTGPRSGKYEVLDGIGESCSEVEAPQTAGGPYNTYTVSVYP